jgi:hypothetical protein
MIEHYVELCCSCCDGGMCFAELGVGVLRSFVEADDAGYEDVGAFKVCDAALDPV